MAVAGALLALALSGIEDSASCIHPRSLLELAWRKVSTPVLSEQISTLASRAFLQGWHELDRILSMRITVCPSRV